MSDTRPNQVNSKKRDGYVKQPRIFFEIKEMTANVAYVWNFLASHTKNYHPSLSEICEKTKLSNRTVIGCIRKLESFNMLKVIRSKRGLNKVPNKYFPIEDESKWNLPSCVKEHHDNQVMCNPAPRSCVKEHHDNQVMCNPTPRSCVKEHHDHVKNSTTKKSKEESKEENIICNTVLQPVDNVDNSKPPYSKSDFKDIVELVNQIHGTNSKETTTRISRYYIRLLKKNELGTLELIKMYAKGVRIGSQFDKSIRLRGKYPIFDTAFKTQFERDLKNAKTKRPS